jgi:hypothetical protein
MKKGRRTKEEGRRKKEEGKNLLPSSFVLLS